MGREAETKGTLFSLDGWTYAPRLITSLLALPSHQHHSGSVFEERSLRIVTYRHHIYSEGLDDAPIETSRKFESRLESKKWEIEHENERRGKHHRNKLQGNTESIVSMIFYQ